MIQYDDIQSFSRKSVTISLFLILFKFSQQHFCGCDYIDFNQNLYQA